MMMEDNMIRVVEKTDKGILLAVFALGMLLPLQTKTIVLNCDADTTTMWSCWNLLDHGLVYDAVTTLMIVLRRWVGYSTRYCRCCLTVFRYEWMCRSYSWEVF
jgi:hypothetical protein